MPEHKIPIPSEIDITQSPCEIDTNTIDAPWIEGIPNAGNLRIRPTTPPPTEVPGGQKPKQNQVPSERNPQKGEAM